MCAYCSLSSVNSSSVECSVRTRICASMSRIFFPLYSFTQPPNSFHDGSKMSRSIASPNSSFSRIRRSKRRGMFVFAAK